MCVHAPFTYCEACGLCRQKRYVHAGYQRLMGLFTVILYTPSWQRGRCPTTPFATTAGGPYLYISWRWMFDMGDTLMWLPCPIKDHNGEWRSAMMLWRCTPQVINYSTMVVGVLMEDTVNPYNTVRSSLELRIQAKRWKSTKDFIKDVTWLGGCFLFLARIIIYTCWCGSCWL